jgi:hypothetical protein
MFFTLNGSEIATSYGNGYSINGNAVVDVCNESSPGSTEVTPAYQHTFKKNQVFVYLYTASYVNSRGG